MTPSPTRLILLDAGPLGLVTNPRESDGSRRCKAWLRAILDSGARVRVLDISVYEVVRELVRAGKHDGAGRVRKLADELGRLPVAPEVLWRAAALWAEARNAGMPTADRAALDADVILAAQAQLARSDHGEVIVATTNIGHLGRFVDARLWEEIA